MGLDDLVRNAVATANELTESLQATCMFKQWDGTLDGFGVPGHLAAVPKLCLAEKKQRLVRTLQKTEEMSSTTLTFLEPIVLSKYDEFAEPGAMEFRPVMNFSGLVDPAATPAGTTYFGVVYLA